MPILFAAMFCGCDPDGSCEAYLYQPAYCLDFELRGPARPYSPQPGDILLATDGKIFWKITHNLAGTGHPHHTGVVFQRPDGSMAVLEAGPHDTVRINNLDWYPHMVEYEQKGRIWIRQRKCPLTPEQSACLTEFCLAQEGKFFALGPARQAGDAISQPRAVAHGLHGPAARHRPPQLLLLRISHGSARLCGNAGSGNDSPCGDLSPRHFLR